MLYRSHLSSADTVRVPVAALACAGMTTRIWMRWAAPAIGVRRAAWRGQAAVVPVLAARVERTERGALPGARVWESVALGVLGVAGIAAVGMAMTGFAAAARAW